MCSGVCACQGKGLHCDRVSWGMWLDVGRTGEGEQVSNWVYVWGFGREPHAVVVKGKGHKVAKCGV